MKPMGGSELMYYTMSELVEPGWDKDVNLILSFCDWKYIDPNRKNVVWQQSNVDQPSVSGMERETFTKNVDAFIFVSNWQRDRFIDMYNINYKKTIIMRNGIGKPFEKYLNIQKLKIIWMKKKNHK